MLSTKYLLLFCLILSISAIETTDENYESKDLVSDLIILRLLKKYIAMYYPITADGACGNHSMQYKQGVKDRKLWALKMFDASTKIPEGFLWGNVNDLGNYDECIGVDAPDSGTGYGSFTGHHCYAYFHPTPETTNVKTSSEEDQYAMEMIQEYFDSAEYQQRLKLEAILRDERAVSGINVPENLGFRWSYCVPSSCLFSDVMAHLDKSVAPLGLTATVNYNDCHTTAVEPFVWLDWFCISVMILLAVFAVLSTSYDLLVTDTASRRPIFLSFSLYTNGKRLLDTSSTGSDVLPAVHGIRFLSIAWVMFCHRWGMAQYNPSPSFDFLLEFLSDPGRMYLRGGSVSVDSFFLLSGMLLSYIFLKEMERGTSFNVPLFYLNRYLRTDDIIDLRITHGYTFNRNEDNYVHNPELIEEMAHILLCRNNIRIERKYKLTPAMAMMILFQVSVFNNLGSGPIWNNAYWEGDNCMFNWWENMLYIQSYLEIRPLCLSQTWYLAVDMQLFWLSPIVLWPLWKWPKIGKIILGFWLAVSIAVVFAISYVNEAHVGMSWHGNYTHMRMSVWLIGIGLGYILHYTKKEAPVLKMWMVLVGWAAALFLTVGNVYLMAPFVTSPLDPITYYQLLHAFLLAIFRPAFAIGLSWIIYACVRGYGGFINSFLSWSFFIPLSRLSYCIYLTHMAVQYAFLSSMRTPVYFSDAVIVPQFFSDMVISIGCASVLSMLVEVPIGNITKSLLERKPLPKKKTMEKDDLFAMEDNKQS